MIDKIAKIDLVDKHREAWLPLIGHRRKFRGKVRRFGHKHRQGENIKKGATLVIVDVHQVHSPYKIDHVWIDYTPELACLGEHIRPNGIIEFEATVSHYTKGGKNSYGLDIGTFEDLDLTEVTNVRVIKEPYFPVSYDSLVDERFLSYIMATRQNLRRGKVVGKDPRGIIGDVRIGQGFCNRFAKTLSWKWINELPRKYGGGK